MYVADLWRECMWIKVEWQLGYDDECMCKVGWMIMGVCGWFIWRECMWVIVRYVDECMWNECVNDGRLCMWMIRVNVYVFW